MINTEKEVECVFRGKVQQVGFRRFAQKHAEKMGLVGYAENEEDGSLTVVAQGEEADLLLFIDLLKKGPYFSRIDSCNTQWSTLLQDSLIDFSIF